MEHPKLPLEMPENKTNGGPVTCLGMTFENDQERREYFTEILRQKLPELKKIEGYPIGEDEDILALSDPPYYTACPNPFINDFIKEWDKEKKDYYGEKEEDYHREPFAADVTEGKNDPVYNAHSYHTKVPYKAIMRYILHYTNPGDIVLDGFAGTGMTGIAAKLCGDEEAVMSLGHYVDAHGFIYERKNSLHGEQLTPTEAGEHTMPISAVGSRKAILNDISPSASFISYNFNTAVSVQEFEQAANRVLQHVDSECRWLYKTLHTDGTTGKINYTVWSDVFICSYCSGEMVFWDVAVNKDSGKVVQKFSCPHCGASLTKRSLERLKVNVFDRATGATISQAKIVPVLINYSVGRKKFEKVPDAHDLTLLKKVQDVDIPYAYPSNQMVRGYNTQQPMESHGYTHVHHFYTKRNLWVLSCIAERIAAEPSDRLRKALFFGFNNVHYRHSNLNAFRFNVSFPSNITSGTLFVPSMIRESNILDQMKNRFFRRLLPMFKLLDSSSLTHVGSVSSATELSLPNASCDYIFTDPPFGGNIMYSELNFLWESWLRVCTNNKKEAIENKIQQKGLNEYQNLMLASFHEYYRVLKPGRWMTVVFSNSQARVWNVIQEAIQRAGFIVANVSTLDKKQGSFKAVTTTTAVKQDLVISAYKPTEKMIAEIRTNENTNESAWTFVRSHLEQLPVFVGKKGEADLIVERTPRVLFDRMVAYHVQNGYSVPISSAEFQAGVAQRFPMRDGMAFLETQVIEYDKKRLLAKEFVQTTLFVSDENSAIEWLRQQLMQKPQTRQDLHPNFMKELQHISKHELLPELDVLLEQNFLMYDGTGPVPSQIHAYLSTDFKDLRNLEKDDPKLQAKAKNRWYVPDPNKQADLEKLRERSLLREFNSYIEELGKSKKKLRQFRTEAIRAGFKTAWGNQDYQTIVDVGQRLPEKVLQEDSTMLMYYDNAQVRLGM